MVWGFWAAGLAYALLVLQMLRQGYGRRPQRRIGMTMLAAAGLSLLWSGLGALAPPDAPLWWWAVQTVDVLRYLCWYGFLALFFIPAVQQPRSPWRQAWWVALAAAPGVVWVLLVAFGGMGGVVLMAALALGGLVLVEQLLRNLPEDAVWSAKPVCLGLAGMFVFDLFLFSKGVLFRALDAHVLSVRPWVQALMVPLLLLSTLRQQHWVARIRVSHQVVFHSATLVLVGVYLLFIAGVGYYVRFLGGEWGAALEVGLVAVALVVMVALVLSGSLRAWLRVLLGKHFFRYRFDYRQEWLKFTTTLSGQAQPQEAGLRVIQGLADMLESPGGALWVQRPGDDAYRQVARWNVAQAAQPESAASPWMAFLRETGWVVNVLEYRSTPGRYRHLPLPPWLAQQPQAWLLVPLWHGQSLLGFVMLAQPRTPVDVNWEVNDLLKTAGRQAASLLAQLQATEALLEARKFEAFNRMSAFVVHDLKNIVAQLSLMVKNAKRLQGNPEFQADMLMTVEHSLERMRQLMLQLRGDAPAGAAPTPVGVNLGKIAERLAAAAKSRGRQVQLDVAVPVFTRGQAERVERIIGHLVHNALDATGEGDRVWLKVERQASQACVEVGDSGAGMSAEFVQTRLFKPFQSTKEAGMGIGTYESFQYVQELGGKISVDSQLGRGTVIRLLLPAMEMWVDAETAA